MRSYPLTPALVLILVLPAIVATAGGGSQAATCWSTTYTTPGREGFLALKPIGTDGDTLVVGAAPVDPRATPVDNDAVLARIARDGSVLWAMRYGGAGNDWATAVWPTPDGGAVLTGAGTSFLFRSDAYNAREPTFWLLRVDANGQPLWAYSYFLSITNGTPRSVQATTDPAGTLTGFVIAGNAPGLQEDGWMARVGPAGELLWARVTGKVPVLDRGAYDEAWRITEVDGRTAFLVGGWAHSDVDPSFPSDRSGWMMKLRQDDGSVIWFNEYGSSFYDEEIFWVKGDMMHHGQPAYVATGYAQSPDDHSRDLWILAVDPATGVPLMQTVFGTRGNDDAFHVHHVPGSDDMLLAGTTAAGGGGANAFVARVDMHGATRWAKVFTGVRDDVLLGVETLERSPKDADMLYAAGYSYSTGSLEGDGWILRMRVADGAVASGLPLSVSDLPLAVARLAPAVPEFRAAESAGLLTALDTNTRQYDILHSPAWRHGAATLPTARTGSGC